MLTLFTDTFDTEGQPYYENKWMLIDNKAH